jgi:phosphatidylserine/phosphatidylglycerophosphate/cardiolipin synthase-like enzyme
LPNWGRYEADCPTRHWSRAARGGNQGRPQERGDRHLPVRAQAVEAALNEAAARGVRVTALIAFVNRGGAKSLRKLELRLLEAGIIVARTADDLIRYHGKYILIDRRVLFVLSFNFTRLDIDHSRGFGVVTTRAACVKEAVKLFKADCTRVKYVAKADTFVVSPVNSRRVLGAFLRGAKKQLLVYDPKISDREMLRILQERAKAGVEIQVIGQVAGGCRTT